MYSCKSLVRVGEQNEVDPIRTYTLVMYCVVQLVCVPARWQLVFKG